LLCGELVNVDEEVVAWLDDVEDANGATVVETFNGCNRGEPCGVASGAKCWTSSSPPPSAACMVANVVAATPISSVDADTDGGKVIGGEELLMALIMEEGELFIWRLLNDRCIC
jgi:hypothetical protein